MNLPLFSRLLQLPIPLRMALLLTPGEHVFRRDVTDGTVQADVINTAPLISVQRAIAAVTIGAAGEIRTDYLFTARA